jgi:hypothetical protein
VSYVDATETIRQAVALGTGLDARLVVLDQAPTPYVPACVIRLGVLSSVRETPWREVKIWDSLNDQWNRSLSALFLDTVQIRVESISTNPVGDARQMLDLVESGFELVAVKEYLRSHSVVYLGIAQSTIRLDAIVDSRELSIHTCDYRFRTEHYRVDTGKVIPVHKVEFESTMNDSTETWEVEA